MLSHSARLRQRIHEAFAASSAAMYPARGRWPVHAEPIHGSARALPEEQFNQRFQTAQASTLATLPAEQQQRLEDLHQTQMRTSPVHASGPPLTGDAYMAERFAIAQSGPRVMLSPEEQLVIEELDRIQIGVSADRLVQSQTVNAGRSEEVDAYLTWFEREFGFFGRALGRGGRRLTAIPQYASAMMLMQLANDVGRTREDILQEEIERYQGASTLQDLTPLAQASALQATQLRYDYIRDDGDAERLEYIRLASEALASAQSILAVVAQIEMSDAATRFRDGTLANAENSVMGTLRAFINDPLNGAAFLTETAAESLPLLAVAGGASLATGQPLVGAAVLAGGSFLEESSTAALQWLADNNVDISTPEAAAAALQNGDLMRQAQAHGLTRGVVIALFDAVSGGVAGRTLARSPAGDLVLQGLAQAALGAGGEAAASYATTGEVNARDATLGGMIGGINAGPTTAAMRGSWLPGMGPEDIALPGGRAVTYQGDGGTGPIRADRRVTDAPLPPGVHTVTPLDVQFSQASVSPATSDGIPLGELSRRMRDDGWRGRPLDIVNMPNGTLTSMDNRRLFAARDADIDVPINVHNFDDLLTRTEIRRYTRRGIPAPRTWGEAILLRIAKQADMPGGGPEWPELNPYGTHVHPEVIRRD